MIKIVEFDSRIGKGVIASSIKCTDAEIICKDNIPYLKYKGEATLVDGRKIIVEYSMMDLTIDRIVNDIEQDRIYTKNYLYLGFSGNSNGRIYLEEKEMTKEDIEKELGYPIKIVK